MKRSKMLELIVESIELHSGNDPGWLNDITMKKQKEQAYDLAHKLLRDLEKAGFLPPDYERGPTEAELQAGLEEGDRVFVRKWED